MSAHLVGLSSAPGLAWAAVTQQGLGVRGVGLQGGVGMSWSSAKGESRLERQATATLRRVKSSVRTCRCCKCCFS